MGPWQEVLAGTCIVFRHLEPLFACQKRGWGVGKPSQMIECGRLRHLVQTKVAIENGDLGGPIMDWTGMS